jgi:hypothetical protein
MRRNKEQQKNKSKAKSNKYPKNIHNHEQNTKKTVHKKQEVGQNMPKPRSL